MIYDDVVVFLDRGSSSTKRKANGACSSNLELPLGKRSATTYTTSPTLCIHFNRQCLKVGTYSYLISRLRS